MEYLLSRRNLRILESFCLVKTLFAFDYDGTLAPISSDPQKAHMTNEVAEILKNLNELSPVAVITGRKAADLRKLLPIDPLVIIGNHGSEGLQSPAELERMKGSCQQWLSAFTELRPVLDELGISIEDKEFSLSFHYRKSHNPEIAKTALATMLSRLNGARISDGKFVMNAVPEEAYHKGMALDRIMDEHNFQFGVYFGDDHTDEDVFRHNNSRLLTVKVGTEPSLAKYYLNSQEEMGEVLQILTSFLTRTRQQV